MLLHDPRDKKIPDSQIECAGNIEIQVNIAAIPPHTKFSREWKAEGELAFVLEGFFVLHQENRADEFYKKGDFGKVPLSRVNTVSTQEEGATILFFSIDQLGQLDRRLTTIPKS